MSVSRCNKCGVVTEHANDLAGTTVICDSCGAYGKIYDTVLFINHILKLFAEQQRELNQFKEAASKGTAIADAPVAKSHTDEFIDFDIHNTDVLTSEIQHSAISKWFGFKGISISLNTSAVDTTGFFDEVAVEIGNQFSILGEVVERIRYAQQKGYESTLIHLDKKTEAESKLLRAFCKQLYEYSLVARSFNNKEEKNIRVVLQSAPSVRKFFAGEWLEWYALMEALKIFRKRKVSFSCARNLTLTLPNADKYELDVFFMLSGTDPIYIECKTGEYRTDIEKYVVLRKKLGISSTRFVMCVTSLEPEQAKGLSAMYGLTFVGASELVAYLETLC